MIINPKIKNIVSGAVLVVLAVVMVSLAFFGGKRVSEMQPIEQQRHEAKYKRHVRHVDEGVFDELCRQQVVYVYLRNGINYRIMCEIKDPNNLPVYPSQQGKQP